MEERLKRIEKVLGALISWMAQMANSPISHTEAESLLAMLSADSDVRAEIHDGP